MDEFAGKNPYEILGIEPGAGADEIKLAYTRLIKQFRAETHPEEFKHIRQAYEKLTSRASEPELTEEDEEYWEQIPAMEAPETFIPEEPQDPQGLEVRWVQDLEGGEIGKVLKELEELSSQKDLNPVRVYRMLKIVSVTVLSEYEASEEIYQSLVSYYPWLVGTPAEEAYHLRAMVYKDYQKWLVVNPPEHLVNLLTVSSVFPLESTIKNYNRLLSTFQREPLDFVKYIHTLYTLGLIDLFTQMMRLNQSLLSKLWSGQVSETTLEKALYLADNSGKLAKNRLLFWVQIAALGGVIRMFLVNWAIGLALVLPFIIMFYILYDVMGRRAMLRVHLPFYLSAMTRDRVTLDNLLNWVTEKNKENSQLYNLKPPLYMEKKFLRLLRMLDGTEI